MLVENPSVVVLLNWNGWQDTINCLRSVLQMDHKGCEVVVVDNGSTDASLDRIREWCLSSKVSFHEYARAEAEIGDLHDLEHCPEIPLTLIRSESNLGFAGGCNIGIRYASRREARYVWLLNNDTTVDSEGLTRLEHAASAYDDRVLLSSRIFFMHDPKAVWFEGGIYNPWIAATRHVSVDEFSVSGYQYLTGCALFIPIRVIREIGLLEEKIFLYAEDVDYSIRVLSAGIPLQIVVESKVFHAVSSSSVIGSSRSYYLHVKNLVWVIRKHFGACRLLGIIPYHLLKLLALVLFLGRPFSIVKAYLSGLFDGSTDLISEKLDD
jgi:GT2 family glycosyltransferase